MKRLHTCLIGVLVVLASGAQSTGAGGAGRGAAFVDFNGDRIVNFRDFARLAQCVDDCIKTPLVLNPAEGTFSLFA